MILYFLLAICNILLIISIRTNNSGGGVFDRASSESLKGIAMCVIILHHIHNNIGMQSRLFSLTGFLATSMFFFISGFGNSISLKRIRHQNDALLWITKRTHIYVVYFVAYVAYSVILKIILHENLLLKTHMLNLLTFTLPKQVTWFPKVYLITVIFHCVLHMVCKSEKKEAAVLVCISFGYITVAWACGLPPFWYNSILCYAVGMGCCINGEKLLKNGMKEWKIIGLTIFMISIFGALYCLPNRPLQIVTPIVMCVTIFCYSRYWKIQSSVLRWIGTHSFEFYCFHLVALEGCSGLIKSEEWYAISVICFSMLMVFMYILMVKKRKRYNVI